MKKSFELGLAVTALALITLLSGCGKQDTASAILENTRQNNDPVLEASSGLNLDTTTTDDSTDTETTDGSQTITPVSNVKIDKNSDIDSLLDGLKEIDTKKINDINDADLNNL